MYIVDPDTFFSFIDKCVVDIPVTMLILSSWLRWLEEPSDILELADENGCSDGQGDGGPHTRDNVVPQPSPERLLGLYLGGPLNGTVKIFI